MSLILSDPTNLITGGDTGTAFAAPLSIDTTAKTITITPGSGILPAASDGVTGQALFSALKLLWKNNSTYIKFPFPMEAITPEQFEFINGWTLANDTTRKALRTCGWVERNASGAIIRMYAGVISLGTLGATDQPYYQQSGSGAATNFTFQGPVNEAVWILSDPNGDGVYSDGFDLRGYLKLFAREQSKTYSQATLTDIGVSSMSYIVYRFPLSNASDLKVTHTDTQITSDTTTYGGITITYFGTPQVRSIGGTNYNFNVIIAGASKSAEQIYEKVQYLLRQNSDIDAGAGVTTGKTADSLLKFVGDTLTTSQGVYIDSFNSNDTNRIEFFDNTNTKRTFPFVAAGTLLFNANLVADPSAKYWVFFTTLPGSNNFGTGNAQIVNDASGNPLTGSISAGSIPFTFAYDSNVQGGRTAAVDAAVTVVAIGLSTAQYVSTTATLTRAVGQNISLTAALERNYQNA